MTALKFAAVPDGVDVQQKRSDGAESALGPYPLEILHVLFTS